jgi:cyclopropane fatty-acyl-phospholipid synthase-like methyltransferase
MGCGVGGSILDLAPRLPARYLGLTLSRVQAKIGNELLQSRGCSEAVIEVADFTDAGFWDRRGEPPFDLAYAIESMLHVPAMLAKLETIRSLIRPGGLLVVVDDFVARSFDPPTASARERRWLADFRRGWYAHGLASCRGFIAAARDAGFDLVEGRDLTPYLELGRPRDRVARAFVAATRWLPVRPEWYNNLLGGNALQMCLRNGVVRYCYLVFRASGQPNRG